MIRNAFKSIYQALLKHTYEGNNLFNNLRFTRNNGCPALQCTILDKRFYPCKKVNSAFEYTIIIQLQKFLIDN